MFASCAGLFASCGGDSATPPTRSYTVDLDIADDEDRYRFRLASGDLPDFTVGDEVTFDVSNTGRLSHDMRITDPDGDTLATAPVAPPGGRFDVTVRLDEPGIYKLDCLVDDHLTTHQMRTLIEVADA